MPAALCVWHRWRLYVLSQRVDCYQAFVLNTRLADNGAESKLPFRTNQSLIYILTGTIHEHTHFILDGRANGRRISN